MRFESWSGAARIGVLALVLAGLVGLLSLTSPYGASSSALVMGRYAPESLSVTTARLLAPGERWVCSGFMVNATVLVTPGQCGAGKPLRPDLGSYRSVGWEPEDWEHNSEWEFRDAADAAGWTVAPDVDGQSGVTYDVRVALRSRFRWFPHLDSRLGLDLAMNDYRVWITEPVPNVKALTVAAEEPPPGSPALLATHIDPYEIPDSESGSLTLVEHTVIRPREEARPFGDEIGVVMAWQPVPGGTVVHGREVVGLVSRPRDGIVSSLAFHWPQIVWQSWRYALSPVRFWLGYS